MISDQLSKGCFKRKDSLTLPSDLFTRKYVFYSLIAFISTILLLNRNFPEKLRFIFLLLISFFSFKSVYTTFFILTTSTMIPDIGLGPFTATQVVLITWVFSWVIRRGKCHLFLSKRIIYILLPFLCWLIISGIITSDYFILIEAIKGIVIGLVAYQMMQVKHIRPGLCLLNIIYGTSVAAVIWYLTKIFGISSFDLGNIRVPVFSGRYGVRFSIFKQDPNSLAMLLNIALWGGLNTIKDMRLILNGKFNAILLLCVSVGTIIPLIETQSRGGLIVSIMALFLTITLWRLHKTNRRQEDTYYGIHYKRWLHNRIYSNVVAIVTLFLTLVSLIAIANLTLGDSIWKNQFENTLSTIKESGLDDRSIRFQEAKSSILASPILGVGMNAYLLNNFNNYPHNTLLDVGVGAGIPGMILFLLMASIPIFFYLRKIKFVDPITNTAVICYLIILGAMMSMSMIGDKLFWILWFIIISLEEQSGGYSKPGKITDKNST